MKDLKHLFVPYDLAVKLKEKGFDEYCLRESDHLKECDIKKNNCGICPLHNILCSYPDCIIDKTKTVVKIPLYQQVIDWFDSKHNINIWVDCSNKREWIWTINFIEKGDYIQSDDEDFDEHYNSKYESLIKAIEEALKLI